MQGKDQDNQSRHCESSLTKLQQQQSFGEKVEEGENPIGLGLAAPAEGSGVTPEQMEVQAAAAPKVTKGTLSEAALGYTTNPAAAAAVALMSSQTDAWGHIQSGGIQGGPPTETEQRLGTISCFEF